MVPHSLGTSRYVLVAVTVFLAIVGAMVVGGHHRALADGPDETGSDAVSSKTIATDTELIAEIYPSGDIDCYSFSAVSGTSYKIITTLITLGGSSTCLYGTDGTTEMCPSSSEIVWRCSSSGIYYIKVMGSTSSQRGRYSLRVAVESVVVAAGGGTDQQATSEPAEKPGASSTGIWVLIIGILALLLLWIVSIVIALRLTPRRRGSS